MYVGVCSFTIEQDCAACICEGGLQKTVTNSNADLDMAQKIQRGRLSVQKKMIWTTKTLEETVECACKKIYKEIVRKNKSGNPDSTNNSLGHPEETLDNETLQATTRSCHNDRVQRKVQSELTYAVPQAERILNMCEIGYEIHISQNL